MKKKLALILAAVMMLGLFAGCSNKAPTGSGDPTGGEDTMRVDVFYYDFSDIYISTVRAAMDEQLKAMGIEPNNWDAAGSQPTQTDQVNTAITAGSDLLIVNIVETATSAPAQDIVNAAKSAGIPVIFFNREVAENDVINSYEKCAFVGTNAPDAGHMQGEMIGNYLLDNYDAVDLNGDGVISYVMFKGQEGNAVFQGVLSAFEVHIFAVQGHGAAVPAVDAEQALHQGGFTRAVLSHQGMDGAGPDRQVHVVQGLDAREFLADAAHLQQCRLLHILPPLTARNHRFTPGPVGVRGSGGDSASGRERGCLNGSPARPFASQ